MLKAAGRLSKQPDVLQREEVLQKGPRLQSTSKERALKCWSNKGSSNARDMFVLSHTRSGAVCRLLAGHLPKEPTSAASPTPASTAQEPRGDEGVPVGPHDSRRAGSDNKAHREHLGSAGRTDDCRNSHPCRPQDLRPGSEPAVSIPAHQRPQNATKPHDFLCARTDVLGARAAAAGGRTSPRRRKRSPLKPTSPADAVPRPAAGNPPGWPGPVWSAGQDASRDVTAATSAQSCRVTRSGPAHPGHEPSLQNKPKGTINHRG